MHFVLMESLITNTKNNMKYITIASLMFILITGCNVKPLSGLYESTCFAYHEHEVELQIDTPDIFSYKFLYVKDPVNGKWIQREDTLFLYSEKFSNENFSEFTPKLKNTNNKDVDKYIVKNGKLYILDSSGLKKNCYLQRSPRK